MCSKIQRTRVKGTWVRTSSSPESEPDFFSMKPVEDFDEFGPDSSQLTKPPSNSTSCLGSEGQNLLGAPYPNFVTPKSSPFLRGGGKFTNSLQHSLSVEEFDLDSAMLQNEQAGHDTHASMNTPVARTFGLHPPPSLLQIASETSATCNFDDQATRESKSSKHALPTTSTRIESTYKTETKRLDVSTRSSCNQKWYSSEIPSLTRLGKALSNPEGLDEEDDELRTFLRDVDLDLGFELEMVEEILQSSVF